MLVLEEVIRKLRSVLYNAEHEDIDQVLDYETLRSAIHHLESLRPVKPGPFYDEAPEHEWVLNSDGSINHFAWEYEFCSGPVCRRCGYSFCEYCNPDGWTAKKCIKRGYSCPKCGSEVFKGREHCAKCGARLEWDEKEESNE